MSKQTAAVGYVRVSRVGGRGGDSFLSPRDRADQCRTAVCVAAPDDAPRSGGQPLEVGAARVLWAVPLDDDGPSGGSFRDGEAASLVSGPRTTVHSLGADGRGREAVSAWSCEGQK